MRAGLNSRRARAARLDLRLSMALGRVFCHTGNPKPKSGSWATRRELSAMWRELPAGGGVHSCEVAQLHIPANGPAGPENAGTAQQVTVLPLAPLDTESTHEV
jgi:hypothetical protein